VALIFPRWTNRAPLALGVAAPLLLGCAIFVAWYWFSPKYLEAGYAPLQPVPFSHKQHAGDLGIDCRYCHNTVERAGFAAIPPTRTCMNCHALVLKESLKLEPIRSSFAGDAPLEWIKVHMLPQYAHFNHGVHVSAGVGCATCHGRIDQLKIVQQIAPLSMSWCLDCHRDPTPNLRPVSEVTNMSWRAEPADRRARPAGTARKPTPPTHCSGCHR
jgi:hypothetical protein